MPGSELTRIPDGGRILANSARTNFSASTPGTKYECPYEEFWNKARPLMVNEKVPMSKVRPYHVWYKEQLVGKGIPAWNSPKL